MRLFEEERVSLDGCWGWNIGGKCEGVVYIVRLVDSLSFH